jgi:hypothetical protein
MQTQTQHKPLVTIHHDKIVVVSPVGIHPLNGIFDHEFILTGVIQKQQRLVLREAA